MAALFTISALSRGTGAYAADPLDQYRSLVHSCAPIKQHSQIVGKLIAQAAPTETAAAAPVPTASAPPTPSPMPSTTIPPVPVGPQQLVAPTPSGSPTIPPIPTPTPFATNSPGPVFITRDGGTPGPIPGKGSPLPSPTATPDAPKLQPGEIAVLADDVKGANREGMPGDADGNVNILYADGRIVGQHAHYDGSRYVRMTGNPYLVNTHNDTILYADAIVFDVRKQQAELVNGRGETSQGVEQGLLYYKAQNLQSYTDGTSHGDRAWFTTCANWRGGYHIETKSVDVEPGHQIVARHATVYLGALAVFYWPLLIIPLTYSSLPNRRSQFLPVIGYDNVEGAYVKARITFGRSDYYYGYYTVNFYTKRGLGLGYTSYISAKNGRRLITIDSYEINDRIQNERLTNIAVGDTENLARNLRAQINTTYNTNFGPNISLPAQFSLNGSLVHSENNGGFENVTFLRYIQGEASNQTNLSYVQNIVMGGGLTQGINLGYTDSKNFLADSSQFQINTLTHWNHGNVDYTLTYNKTDATIPFGYNTEPELRVVPQINWHGFRFPFTVQFALGEYTEPQNAFSAGRINGLFSWPVSFHVLGSDLTYAYTLNQDYYTTGDEKAFATQQGTFTTPIDNHVINTISYNEQNPIGPANVPFQLFDRLSSGSHAAQDLIRFYNKDVYSITISGSTYFDQQAQPIGYQLVMRPSFRSALLVGGNWNPGPGQGFYSTNVQWITPLGKYTDAQFVTNIDWKNKGRLENKSIYLHQIIGNCYEFRAIYNEDLKTFNLEFNLLAFPSRAASAGFGLNAPTQILPQNFVF